MPAWIPTNDFLFRANDERGIPGPLIPLPNDKVQEALSKSFEMATKRYKRSSSRTIENRERR